MKRLMMLAAIALFAGGMSAQAGMGEDPLPKEEPKEQPKDAPKEEPKKDEPKKEEPRGAARPRRPGAERRQQRRPEPPRVDRAALEEEFNALDRDDDKKLTKEELGEKFAPMLEKHDADKSGNIELEEWIKARSEAPPRRPGPGRERDMQGDAFKNMDKNGDGKISKEEAGPRVKDNFDKWDGDKDGFLTREEFDKGIQSMRGDRPPRRPPPEGDRKPESDKPAEPPKEAPKEEPKEPSKDDMK